LSYITTFAAIPDYMKKSLIYFCLLISIFAFGQAPQGKPGNTKVSDSAKKAPIDLYKIISIENDTTHLDTTLTIEKDYKFNYLRKDNFALLPFSNTGQTYNALSLEKDYDQTFSGFGARARHYNFMEAEDINYYFVPTPLTELYFKTVPEQGQQLDAFFTVNTSENLNMFIGYKGLRALGKYQHILTSTGNLRLGFSYQSDNDRYRIKAHFVAQDLLNEENGGLTTQSLQQYLDREEEFSDRSVLDVNYENVENVLYGKRFFAEQSVNINNPADSTNNFLFGHRINYSWKKYVFKQDAAVNSLYGNSFESSDLRDVTKYANLENEVSLSFKNKYAGKIEALAGITNYDYGYNSVVIKENDTVGNRLRGSVMHLGGGYSAQFGGFNLEAKGKLNLSEEFPGNFLDVSAGYDFDEQNRIRFGFSQNSTRPNFNFLLYQSDYLNYNWQNDFDNVSSQRLYAQFDSKKIAAISGNLAQIQNYTYFAQDDSLNVRPFQSGNAVRFYKIKAERGFDFGRFGMHHTIMYQDVVEGFDVLNLPKLVTRNSIYYKDYWFDKALYLQTGFTLNYFSKYQMNAYDPVLAEFYVQNDQELGGYPVVDYFFNAKVDQARIFFKLQHLNALLKQNNNLVAPNYPYTDFLIRFGLVWNFFF